MVKFGEELETALFPLWKSYYIDYAMMKKAIKAVCAHYPYMDLLKRHNIHILNDPSRPFELVICGVVFTYHEDTSITNNDGSGGIGGSQVTHTNERMFVRVTEGFLPSTIAEELAARANASAAAAAGSSSPPLVPITSAVTSSSVMNVGKITNHNSSNHNTSNISVSRGGEGAAAVAQAPGRVGVGLNSRSCHKMYLNALNPDDDGWAPPVTHPHFIDSFTVPSAAVYEADPHTACPDDVHHPPAVGTYKLLAAVDAKNVMKLRETADFDGDNAVRRCLDFSSKGYIFAMVRAYRQASKDAEALAKKRSATTQQMGGGGGGGVEGFGKAILNQIGGRVMMVFDPAARRDQKAAVKAAAVVKIGDELSNEAEEEDSAADTAAKSNSDKKGDSKTDKKNKKGKKDDKDAGAGGDSEEEGTQRYFRIVATAASEKPCMVSMRFYMCTAFPTVASAGGGVDNRSMTNNATAAAAGEIAIKHLVNYHNPTIGHAIYCYQHMVSNVLASVIKSEIEKVTNFYISQSHMACSSALLCVDGVKMWADLSAKERSQLRIAFRQTYSTLDMIQQYCDLNCVAVGKILKKMDKNTNQNMLEAYRHAIEEGGLKFKMGRNSRIAKLQHILADSYGKHALGKGHKKGLEFLDAREFVSRRDQQPTLLSLTALAGIVGTMIYFVVTTMWSMVHDKGYIFPPGTHADTYGAYLALIPLVIVSLTFLFSINVMVWEYFGINFAFMFELDPIFHWSGAELMRDSLIYILVWLACVYHFLLFNSREEVICAARGGGDSWVSTTTTTTTTTTDALGNVISTTTNAVVSALAFQAQSLLQIDGDATLPVAAARAFSAVGDSVLKNVTTTNTTTTTTLNGAVVHEDHTSVYILYWVWPLWLCIYVAKAVFNKYAFNNRKPWIAIICKRIVTTPMTTVKFADFFIADQITSLTGIFFEMQFYWCVWFTPKTDHVCSAGRAMGLCFLSILPNTWRLIQCFRRYHDQPKAVRKAFPNLVNAGKYGSSMAEIIVWMIYNILKYTDAFGKHVSTSPTYVDSDYCEQFYDPDDDDFGNGTFAITTKAITTVVTTIASTLASTIANMTTTVIAPSSAVPTATTTSSYSPSFSIPKECIIEGKSYWLSGDHSDELWMAFCIACGVSIFSQIYKYLWDIVVDAGIWIKVTPPPPAVPHWKLRDEKIYRDWWPYIVFIIEDFILRSAWAIKFWVAPWTKGHGWMFALWSIVEVFRRFVWNFFRVENEHVNNTEGYRATKLAPTPAKQIATWDTMADELSEKYMKDKDRTSAEFPTIKGINLTGITKFFARLPEEEKLNILLQGYSEVQLSAFGAPPAGGAAGFALQLKQQHQQPPPHHVSEANSGSSMNNRGIPASTTAAAASAPVTPASPPTGHSDLLFGNNGESAMNSAALFGMGSPAAVFEGVEGEGKSRFFSELPEEEKVILLLSYLKEETMNDYLRRIGVICEEGKIIAHAPASDGEDGAAATPPRRRRATIVSSSSGGILRGPNGEIISPHNIVLSSSNNGVVAPAAAAAAAPTSVNGGPSAQTEQQAPSRSTNNSASSVPFLHSRTLSGGVPGGSMSPRLTANVFGNQHVVGGASATRVRAGSLAANVTYQSQQQQVFAQTTDHIPRLPTTPRPGTYNASGSVPTAARSLNNSVSPNLLSALTPSRQQQQQQQMYTNDSNNNNNNYSIGVNNGDLVADSSGSLLSDPRQGAASAHQYASSAESLPFTSDNKYTMNVQQFQQDNIGRQLSVAPSSICEELPPSMATATAPLPLSSEAHGGGTAYPQQHVMALPNANAAPRYTPPSLSSPSSYTEPPIIPFMSGAEAAEMFLLRRPPAPSAATTSDGNPDNINTNQQGTPSTTSNTNNNNNNNNNNNGGEGVEVLLSTIDRAAPTVVFSDHTDHGVSSANNMNTKNTTNINLPQQSPSPHSGAPFLSHNNNNYGGSREEGVGGPQATMPIVPPLNFGGIRRLVQRDEEKMEDSFGETNATNNNNNNGGGMANPFS